jgi:LAO/AO transport system kinase
MSRKPLTLDDYTQGILAGNRAVLGRALTLVESDLPAHQEQTQELLQRLARERASAPPATRLGITGVPGVGKSTFIEALGLHLLKEGSRVAVLAVDPTSTLSGGSILGDKTRMERLSQQEGAFIRPSPSRGSLGGVTRKTRESILVCEAAGFDVILVETVGVGQSEVEVAKMVDTFLVLLLAGAGDELQGIKRGIVELADLLAINKADGDNRAAAEVARREYAAALHYLRPSSSGWRPRVLTCSALEGKGIVEVWQAVKEHRQGLLDSGALEARRRRQQLEWMWSLVEDHLLQRLRRHPALMEELPQIEANVKAGILPATVAARRILEELDRVL